MYKHIRIDQPTGPGWWWLERDHHEACILRLVAEEDGLAVSNCHNLHELLQKYVDIPKVNHAVWTGPIPVPEVSD